MELELMLFHLVQYSGVKQYFEAEPKAKEMLEKSSLLRRIGEPEEIGELVSFLLQKDHPLSPGRLFL